MRPDVLALEGSVERLCVAVLPRHALPDKLEPDAEVGRGLSELFACILGTIVAPDGGPEQSGLAVAAASTGEPTAISAVVRVSNR